MRAGWSRGQGVRKEEMKTMKKRKKRMNATNMTGRNKYMEKKRNKTIMRVRMVRKKVMKQWRYIPCSYRLMMRR
jgi:hypothetical protein